MDRLSKRYACPFFIVDEMIALHTLQDFVIEFYEIIREEETTQYKWEFFLHKVMENISFTDWSKRLEKADQIEMTNDEIMEIINASKGVIDMN